MPPDFLIVGNVARDLVPGGWRPGGTAVYAAHVAAGLGRRAGLVTAATADVVEAGLPVGVDVMRHPAATCTTFENIYTAAGRVQYLRAPGEPLPATALPEHWRAARVSLLGPVYHEVGDELAARLTGLIGVCVQGYLRRCDADQRVRPVDPASWENAALLSRVSAIFLSDEDIATGGDAVVTRWAAAAPFLAITNGPAGARVHADGEWRQIPALPATEVDPTGAGDAFAAGCLIALDEGAGAWQAARFGAAVAALVVEGVGPVMPSRAAVEARLAQHR